MARIHSYDGSAADIGSLSSLMGRALVADSDVPVSFPRKVLLDLNFDPQGLLLARDEATGSLQGYSVAIVRRYPLEDGPDDRDRGYITSFGVAPEARRQGVGAALFREAEAFLRGRGCTSAHISPYAPNYFTPGVDVAAYPEAVAFLPAIGYQELYRPLAMDAGLVGYRTPEWVRAKQEGLRGGGITVSDFEPRHLTPLLLFLREHFPGDWQRFIRAAMEAILLGAPPERLCVAEEAEGTILGFAHFENERFGPFGVAASERGRGIGVVLLDHSLRAMRARGLHNAWFLWTDDRTARLYAGFGFRETRRFALFRKLL